MTDLTNVKAARQYFQAENKEKLVVTFDIITDGIDGNPQSETRSLAFDLEDSEDFIKESLQKYVDNYNNEKEAAIENKERDELEAKANETIEALEGFEISNKNARVNKEDE